MKDQKNTSSTKNIDGIVKTQAVENVVAPETTVTESKKAVNDQKNKSKKRGFLGKTLAELKLVKWPTWKYVTGWSVTIIIFTIVIGSVLGFTDYYFESALKFVDCTSPNGSKNQSINDCLKDLTTDLTFQKYINRKNGESSNTNATPEATPPTEIKTDDINQPTIQVDSPATTNTPQEKASSTENITK